MYHSRESCIYCHVPATSLLFVNFRETENEKRHEEFEHDSMEEILQVNEGPSADTTQNQSFPIGGDSLGNNASYRHPSPV